MASFGEKEISEWQRHPEVFQKYANHRVFQNKQVFLDDEGNVVPEDVVVYQDLMIFKNLFKGSYFGGRALVAERNMKNVKK